MTWTCELCGEPSCWTVEMTPIEPDATSVVSHFCEAHFPKCDPVDFVPMPNRVPRKERYA